MAAVELADETFALETTVAFSILVKIGSFIVGFLDIVMC